MSYIMTKFSYPKLLLCWAIFSSSSLMAQEPTSTDAEAKEIPEDANTKKWWQNLSKPETAGAKMETEVTNTSLQSQQNLAAPKSSSIRETAPSEQAPHWSVMILAGYFKPSTPDWKTHFDDSSLSQIGFGASYHLLWGLSVKSTLRQLSADGKGTLSTGGLGADLEYQLRPYQLGLNYEYAKSPVSIVRPFVGLGYTYATYEQKISDGSTIKGHATGYFYEAGLLFNFYKWDSGTSKHSSARNIFWQLDVQNNILESGGTDIGGISYNAGLQFRF